MQLIGMIGGMSWESSAEYYRIANETVRAARGGHHSARLVMYSVDFEQIERYQTAGQWDEAAKILCDAAQAVERAGAAFVVLCTNTMHKLAKEIQDAISIPLLHIADATGEIIQAQNLQRVGLLGTRYTMEQPFYRDRLTEMGLDVLVPRDDQRQLVHDVIYNELCVSELRSKSRERFKEIIADLARGGAQAVILGCTEIGLLIKQHDVSIPIFDTTRIHAEAAAKRSMR